MVKVIKNPNAYLIAKNILKSEIIRNSKCYMHTKFFLEHIKKDYHKNRSRILHGLKPDYPNADYSTKLILTLIMLFHLINEDVLT